MTYRFGVLGHPIAHSLSPFIHNIWLREVGLDGIYEKYDIPPDTFEADIAAMLKRGVVGLNITMPHKAAALAASVSATETAKLINAANTLKATKEGWVADNTDVGGFTNSLRAFGEEVSGRRIGVIGAGGAARAVVMALSKAGAEVVIFNRTLERAVELAEKFDGVEAYDGPWTEGIRQASGLEMLVNTASFGYTGHAIEIGPGAGRVAYDISYGKSAQSFLQPALDAGWTVKDGLRMLVEQAALSFNIWIDIVPETEDVYVQCRELIEVTI